MIYYTNLQLLLSSSSSSSSSLLLLLFHFISFNLFNTKAHEVLNSGKYRSVKWGLWGAGWATLN